VFAAHLPHISLKGQLPHSKGLLGKPKFSAGNTITNKSKLDFKNPEITFAVIFWVMDIVESKKNLMKRQKRQKVRKWPK
jgi:hypothetical protein